MTTTPKTIHTLILCLFAWMTATPSSAQVHSQQWKHTLRQTDEAFFKTDEARRIGEQLMLYQRVTGGWPKNINMVVPLTQEQRETSAMPIPTKCWIPALGGNGSTSTTAPAKEVTAPG